MRSYGASNVAAWASAPAVGPAGSTYFNTTENQVYVSNGTVWLIDAPRGLRAAGVFGVSQSLSSSDTTLTGTALSPFTEANRFYQVNCLCTSLDPAGFVAGLHIITPRIGSVMLWPQQLHTYMSAAYQGWENSWFFHSGTGGNDVTLLARTTSTMKYSANGVRTLLIDLGYSSQASRGSA